MDTSRVITMKHVSIHDLTYSVWRSLLELYFNDPYTHVYMLYDLIYELNKIDLHLLIHDSKVIGYLLLWYGHESVGAHIWGKAYDLVKYLPRDSKTVIQVYNRELLRDIIQYLKLHRCNIYVKYYLDMIVDEKSFKPHESEKVKRLSEADIDKFIELKLIQGRSISEELAKERID